MNENKTRNDDLAATDAETVAADQNRDPITGAPDSHPAGTGIGSASGAVTGAALGAIGGPVGALIGGVAGAITGAAMGHSIGEASAEDDVEDGTGVADGSTVDPVLDRDIQAPTDTTVRPTATSGVRADDRETVDRV